MNAHDLFHAGKLQEALAAALDQVRQHPTDTGRRLFLAELLCFSGQLERADNHLDTLGQQDPQTVAGVQAFRQLIRAERARQEFFTEGRLPEFLGQPEEAVRLLLEASIRVREGRCRKPLCSRTRPRVSGPKSRGSATASLFKTSATWTT